MVQRLVALFGVLFVVEQTGFLAWAAVSHRIIQRDRAFSLSRITIAAGDSLVFTNDDPFLHQIYVKSPRLNFESDEQPPGETLTVKFPTRGVYTVRCHIHPKMSLAVTVE